MGANVLDDLKRKAHILATSVKTAEGSSMKLYYALFARAGFTAALETTARAEGVLLVGPEDLSATSV